MEGHNCQHEKWDLQDCGPYVTPFVEYKKGKVEGLVLSPERKEQGISQEGVYLGPDIVKLEHIGNPMLIFGYPLAGKTSLCLRLVNTAREYFEDGHWIRVVEFRRLHQMYKSLEQKPKFFLQLLALQMEMKEVELQTLLRQNGELFLDGFDEIPCQERNYIWKLLPQIRATQCQTRIWILCRNHMKPILTSTFPDYGHFEICKYNHDQQMDLLYFTWKEVFFPGKTKAQYDKLYKFTESLFEKMEWSIPNFDETLGCLPVVIEIMATVFMENVRSFLKDDGNHETTTAPVSLVMFMEKLVHCMVEAYRLKTFPGKKELEDPQYLPKRVTRLCTEFAIKTFPDYEAPTTSDDMYRYGFILRDETINKFRFHHNIIAEYFLAKYGFSEGIKDISLSASELDKFYCHVLSFEPEVKNIYSFYEHLPSVHCDYRLGFIHSFIVRQYKLGKGHETHREWKKIKDDGNIWHLAVFQGYYRTALLLLSSFVPKRDKEGLRKFLRMRVPVDIVEGGTIFKGVNMLNPIDEDSNAFPVTHLLSSISVLALYGYGTFVENVLELFMKTFKAPEIQQEFNQSEEGSWTPLHYAAIHFNYWFFKKMYTFRNQIEIKPGHYCPQGYLPTHLLMTLVWLHVMKIQHVEHVGPLAKINPNTTRTLLRDREVVLDLENVPGLMETLKVTIDNVIKVGGEDVNAFDKRKEFTLLQKAIQVGCYQVVKQLINLGADVNLANANGMTPLHVAGFYGRKDTFQLLVRHGAKIVAKDCKGLSPIRMWMDWGQRLYLTTPGFSLTPKDILFFGQCLQLDKRKENSSFKNGKEKVDNQENAIEDVENNDSTEEDESKL